MEKNLEGAIKNFDKSLNVIEKKYGKKSTLYSFARVKYLGCFLGGGYSKKFKSSLLEVEENLKEKGALETFIGAELYEYLAMNSIKDQLLEESSIYIRKAFAIKKKLVK